MAGVKKAWWFKPQRELKPGVPDSVKAGVERKCNELVETVLKPGHIKPLPEDKRFNYLVDIYTKWYRNYFYFCAKYCSPHPDAISPFVEDKFARLEYAGEDRFNLSYMRHTGQWFEIFSEITLEECIEAIKEMPHFMP